MSTIKKNFPALTNISDLFNDDWFSSKWGGITTSMPAVNVSDNKDSYEIEVAAPGIKKDDFEVFVENGILKVSGATKTEEEEKKKNYTRKEFSSVSFTRSFSLPDNVNESAVEAKHEDGILKVSLKKTTKDVPPKKKVNVK